MEELRARLDARFTAALERALALSAVRHPPVAWPRFRLPVAVRETLVAADGFPGGCPEPVIAYYTEKLPALLVQQLFVAEDPAARLLWRRLDHARLPRFAAAVAGIRRLAPHVVAGLDEALSSSPAELFARTLFGSGMPLLGAFPVERETMAADLAAGVDPDDVIDLRLSGNLVHEICHGRPRDDLGAPPPWTLLEAAALHLGMRARHAHVFPEVAAEAIPGVAMFVLVGVGLERLFGAPALWGLLDGEPLAARFGAAAGPLAAAGWEAWLARRQPPFVADALDAESWIKLADLARAGGTATLAEAGRRPWRELPWSAGEPTAADRAMVSEGVRALFLVNVLAPNLQTHPAELPGETFTLDVEACRLAAAPRRAGVFGEPAWWIFPPPLARRLERRGIRRVVVTGARRDNAALAAERILELCAGKQQLSEEVGILV